MKRVMATAAVLAAFGGCASAPAYAEVAVLSGFLSKHAKAGYNEQNAGIGLKVGKYAVGYYRNSLHRSSVYAGREFRLLGDQQGLSAGVLAGVVSGYNVRPVLPAALPYLAYRKGRYEVGVVVQPLNLKQSPSMMAVQLRVYR